MNEKDLAGLSYKELQALAVKYRVPGNIKKHLLVRVLRAVKNGNETEVEEILGELQQARKKKRLKKIKREKLIVSTPMHSPNYAMSEDCYYPQQQPPYQWVGAQEEIANRDEGTLRVPDYDEFERFLLRRIQRDYQSYGLSENSDAPGHSIVDLRMGAGSSALEPVLQDANRVKSNIMIDPNSYAHACLSEAGFRTTDDANGNNQEPVLLKKMLEAPAGANLGAIASPEMGLYRSWMSDKYPNVNNALDDSDTLTADSEIDNDDTWETNLNVNNNNNNNNNNNGATGYYCIVNSNKVANSCVNQSNAQDRSFQDSQLGNNILTDGTNHYQVVYPLSELQANCQKWVATNSFVNGDVINGESLTDNTRGFRPIYYEETFGNSTTSKPINLESKNNYNGPNQNLIYEANQTLMQGQISDDSHQFYQNVNAVTTASVNPIDVYYSQQMSKRVGEATQQYYGQGSSYVEAGTTLTNVYQPNAEVHHNELLAMAQINGTGYNKETGNYVQSDVSNGLGYNVDYYQQYHHGNDQIVTGYPDVGNTNNSVVNQGQNHNYNHEHQQQPVQATQTQDSNGFKNSAETTSVQPVTNGALNSFWPRWPINGTVTSDGQLETILNLHNCNYVDYTKIDQTSCVYCYTAPVVTQRTDSSNSLCTQKRRFVAECRQHVFSPNRLVYNDASTGMKLANRSELSSTEIAEPERSNSTTDPDSGTRIIESEPSSDNSINDVWIHDYSRYPVSSDNEPQSVGLIIDENGDDLFSL